MCPTSLSQALLCGVNFFVVLFLLFCIYVCICACICVCIYVCISIFLFFFCGFVSAMYPASQSQDWSQVFRICVFATEFLRTSHTQWLHQTQAGVLPSSEKTFVICISVFFVFPMCLCTLCGPTCQSPGCGKRCQEVHFVPFEKPFCTFLCVF